MVLRLTQPLTNENQENFLGGKGGRCIGLTTLPPSCANCLEIWEPQRFGNLMPCPGVYRDWKKITLIIDVDAWTSGNKPSANKGTALWFSFLISKLGVYDACSHSWDRKFIPARTTTCHWLL